MTIVELLDEKNVFFLNACSMEILLMVEASRKHPGLPNFFHQKYNTSMKELRTVQSNGATRVITSLMHSILLLCWRKLGDQ